MVLPHRVTPTPATPLVWIERNWTPVTRAFDYSHFSILGTSFYQQRLTAWRPDFTSTGSVIRKSLTVGSAFIVIGVIVLITTNNVSIWINNFSIHIHMHCLYQSRSTVLKPSWPFLKWHMTNLVYIDHSWQQIDTRHVKFFVLLVCTWHFNWRFNK